VLLGFCAALAAAVLFGSASIVQATAVRRIPRSAGLSTRLVVELLGQPLFLIAMAMNLVGFSLHLVALRSIPLFLAQATGSWKRRPPIRWRRSRSSSTPRRRNDGCRDSSIRRSMPRSWPAKP